MFRAAAGSLPATAVVSEVFTIIVITMTQTTLFVCQLFALALGSGGRSGWLGVRLDEWFSYLDGWLCLLGGGWVNGLTG